MTDGRRLHVIVPTGGRLVAPGTCAACGWRRTEFGCRLEGAGGPVRWYETPVGGNLGAALETELVDAVAVAVVLRQREAAACTENPSGTPTARPLRNQPRPPRLRPGAAPTRGRRR
jgi:hypothetical protein